MLTLLLSLRALRLSNGSSMYVYPLRMVAFCLLKMDLLVVYYYIEFRYMLNLYAPIAIYPSTSNSNTLFRPPPQVHILLRSLVDLNSTPTSF